MIDTENPRTRVRRRVLDVLLNLHIVCDDDQVYKEGKSSALWERLKRAYVEQMSKSPADVLEFSYVEGLSQILPEWQMWCGFGEMDDATALCCIERDLFTLSFLCKELGEWVKTVRIQQDDLRIHTERLAHLLEEGRSTRACEECGSVSLDRDGDCLSCGHLAAHSPQ